MTGGTRIVAVETGEAEVAPAVEAMETAAEAPAEAVEDWYGADPDPVRKP